MIKIIKYNNQYQDFKERRYGTIAFWAKHKTFYEVDIHIQYIIDNPDKFDLSLNDIKSIYKKYNERLGSEGKAREELIRFASKDGWIRIRHYVTPRDYWTIQFDNYNKRKRTINYFIDWALSENLMKIYDAVSLLGYDDNYQVFYSTPEGGVGKMIESKKGIINDTNSKI